MARDGSGNFSLLSVLAPPGTTNDPTTINAIMDDIALALTGSINTAGTKPWAANQGLAGFKFTSMGDGTAASDSINLGQAQKNSKNTATVVGGTVDAIALTFSPPFTTLTTGMEIKWASAGANTITGVTIAIDAIGGTKALKKGASVALAVGDSGVATYINRAIYDGTAWIQQNPATTVTFVGGVLTATTSMSGKAFNNAKAASVASAATCDIWTPADGNLIHITGTTGINSFGTAPQAGAERILIFDGAVILTNGANLALPGAANYTTAAGDIVKVIADTTTAFKLEITKADGTAVVAAAAGLTGACTLLGTLSTASGNSWVQALGATYKAIRFVGSGVSNNGTFWTVRVQITDDGVTYGAAIVITPSQAAAADTVGFWGEILNTGVAATTKQVMALASNNAGSGGGFVGTEASENGITHSIKFTPSGGNGDAGSITVWGLN